MKFKIISEVTDIETIAAGRRIRVVNYLQRTYGKGRWRKLKGIGLTQLDEESTHYGKS